MKLVGTMHRKTTAFHPQTDGQTERMNKVLEDMLGHCVKPSQNNWDVLLPVLEFAVNNAWNESIQNTPFFLNYGRHLRTPQNLRLDTDVPAAGRFLDTIHKAAKECLAEARRRQKEYADKKRSVASFEVGDKVLLNTKNITFKAVGSNKKGRPI